MMNQIDKAFREILVDEKRRELDKLRLEAIKEKTLHIVNAVYDLKHQHSELHDETKWDSSADSTQFRLERCLEILNRIVDDI